jgi:hypothetical protein
VVRKCATCFILSAEQFADPLMRWTSALGQLVLQLVIWLVALNGTNGDCSSGRSPFEFQLGVFIEQLATPSHVANAITMALEHVTASGILADDSLSLSSNHTWPSICDAANILPYALQAVDANVTVIVLFNRSFIHLFSHLTSNLISELTQAVIGPHCSVAVVATSPVLTAANIPQLVIEATAPSLFNSTQYPQTLLLTVSDTFQSLAIVKVVSHFGWERVAVIGSSDLYGSEGSAALVQTFRNNLTLNQTIDISYPPLITLNATSTDVTPVLSSLKLSNHRCFVLFMPSGQVKAILEAAFGIFTLTCHNDIRLNCSLIVITGHV